jgi:hypothetical protein
MFAMRFYGGARQRAMIAVRFQWRRTAKAKDCRAFFCQRMAKAVTCRLVRAPSVAFLCRAPPRDARQRKFTVRCQKRRTEMGGYCANRYRVLFAVRPDEKRTAKTLSCVFGPLHGKPPVSDSEYTYHSWTSFILLYEDQIRTEGVTTKNGLDKPIPDLVPFLDLSVNTKYGMYWFQQQPRSAGLS